jgi:hypothetical protein
MAAGVRPLAIVALVASALAGCDPGETHPEAIDPEDTGSDEDLGAGDLGPTPVEVHGALRVSGAGLVDAAGERVQLAGVSSMWLNWESDGFAEDETALRWMRNNWKLSVVRASMGIEPDGAYLTDPVRARGQVERIVANAVAAGVYVIIDWHDHRAHEHQQQAAQFFAEMAEQYGDLPNVIYEPFNEPEQVDWATVVKPYHQAVVAAVRAADPDNVIILGTPSWSQNVDAAAIDPVPGTNLVYTLHFYSCTHDAWLRQKADAALAAGAALFVTEWGASHADGGTDGKVCLEEASAWHEWMNAKGISWTAWKLDNCAQDSTCILAPGHGPFVRARMQE